MTNNLVAIAGFPEAARGVEPTLDHLGGPRGLVGRIAGLGAAEMEAGIPGWAWFGVGFVVGATVMYVTGDRVRKFMND